MISLKSHNIIDYVAAALLFLSPFLFGFVDVEMARNTFMFNGLVLLLYSLFTNYHYALVRVLPLGMHMTLDVLLGVFLVTAPWILNYRGFITPAQEYWHYVVGIALFFAVGLTSEKTESEKRAHGVLVAGQGRA